MIDVRELSFLFGPQAKLSKTMNPEYYLLMKSFISHETMHVEDVVHFIYVIFQKCISDENNHFLAIDVLLIACKRIANTEHMTDILATSFEEGCAKLLKSIKRGHFTKAMVDRKEH